MLVRSLASSSSAVKPTCVLSRSFASSSRHSAPKSSEAKKAEQRSRGILRSKARDVMSIPEAASVLKAVEVRSPRSAYELCILTHFAKGSVSPRGRVSLPHDPRTGEEKILVFADGKHAEAAKKLGVAYVGGEELIDSILSEKIIPTKVLCTPALLPKISKLARFLGPKGLMPAARRGTVTEDIVGAIKSISGTLDWKADKEGVVRIPIGRLHYTTEELERNVGAFVNHVRETTATKDDLFAKKKTNVPSILRVLLGSTRGPSIPLQV